MLEVWPRPRSQKTGRPGWLDIIKDGGTSARLSSSSFTMVPLWIVVLPVLEITVSHRTLSDQMTGQFHIMIGHDDRTL